MGDLGTEEFRKNRMIPFNVERNFAIDNRLGDMQSTWAMSRDIKSKL